VTFILRNPLLAFISMMETEFFNKRIKTGSKNLRHKYVAVIQLLHIVREILYILLVLIPVLLFSFFFLLFFKSCGTLSGNE